MALQNRVDPFGELHSVAARGLFTGNRGSIHDPDRRTLTGRRWTTKSWIICGLDFKGRKRTVFGRNARTGGPGWTELFFLDEVTALAAGHRPCFECRHANAKAFAECFCRARSLARTTVKQIDDRLHAERLVARRRKSGHADRRLLNADTLATLPDGTVVAVGQHPFALRGGRALPWRFEGYGKPTDLSVLPGADIELVTPPTTLAVLQAGFQPLWHPSAG